MRTDFGKLLDDMVQGYDPLPTNTNDEINRKVEEVEKKLTDMIESKLSNINISQEKPKPVEELIDTAQETNEGDNATSINE